MIERVRMGWLDADVMLGRRAERLIAWFRVVGGAIGVAITISEASLHPPVMYVIEQSIYVALFATGVAVFVLLPRLSDEQVVPLMRVTMLVDAVLMTAIEPSNAWVDDVLSTPVGILVPLIGGLKFGVPGAWFGAGAFALSQVVYEYLRIEVFETGATVEHSVGVVVIGSLMGFLAGRLSADAREGKQRAEIRAAEVEQAREDLALAHRVVVAGFGGDADAVVHRMLDELEDVDIAEVHLRDGANRLMLVAANHPAAPILEQTKIGISELEAADGPMIVDGVAADEKVAVTAIHGRAGEVVGAFVVGAARGGANEPDHDRLDVLQALADHMGLAIEAGRAYEHEAVLADRYQELNRLKTDFITVASHELRTPVTAVVGFTELLRGTRDELDDQLAEDVLERLHLQASRLHHLVADISLIGDLSGPSPSIEPRPVSLRPLVERVVEERTAVGVEVRIDPDLAVEADPGHLRVCLRQLLDNALTHGATPIAVSAERGDERVRLEVEDHGPGIAEDRIERIFEPFVVGGDVNAHQRGSGLGLAIVHRLAALMGGSVEVVSPPDGGARFILTLPVSHRGRMVASRTEHSFGPGREGHDEAISGGPGRGRART